MDDEITLNDEQNTNPNSPNLSSPSSSSNDTSSEATELLLKNDMILITNDVDEEEAARKQFQSPRFSCHDAAAARFPAAMFTRPGTPGEWSVASNESLFSIQLGNFGCTSFSATPMFRSGELNNNNVSAEAARETPTFPRINDALRNVNGYAWPRDNARLKNHLGAQCYQFPVLPVRRDGGWMTSSPKMLEMKRQRMARQLLQPPQPLLHIMTQRRKQQQQRSLPKPKNHISYSSLFSRLFCFSNTCCTPIRRNE